MNRRKMWLKVQEFSAKGVPVREIALRLKISKSAVSRLQSSKEEPSEFVKCKRCGETFIPNKYYPNQKFCCDNCRRIYWRKKYKKLGTDKKLLLTCNYCGRLFYADRKTVKFCSRECYLSEVSKHE